MNKSPQLGTSEDLQRIARRRTKKVMRPKN